MVLAVIAVSLHVLSVGLAALAQYSVELINDPEFAEDNQGMLTAMSFILLIWFAVWVVLVIGAPLVSCAAAFGVWLRALIVHLPKGKHPWPEMFALTTVLLVGSVTSALVGLALLRRGYSDGQAGGLALYVGVGAGSVLLVLAVGAGCIVSALRVRRARA